MKKILLRIILLFFSFFVLFFFLFILFRPIYKTDSIIFTFAITPFDIAKVYPKIWIFIKKTYFLFMFISYTIIFNYLFNSFQKYFKYKNTKVLVKNMQTDNINDGNLSLFIGKNDIRKKYLFKWSWSLSKLTNYWNYRHSEKHLLQCTHLPNS